MLKRLYENHLAASVRVCALPVARAWRERLTKALFIGVTGSCGKTTTKEMIAAVLNTRFTGVRNPGSSNGLFSVFKTVLRTRRTHDYCLMEMAVGRKGGMAQALSFFPPQIGVVLNIGTDHYTVFRGPAGVAEEKGKLVEALPESGTAILNADDPLVLDMAGRTRAKIFTFGLSPRALLRAENVTSAFPEPLSFTAVYGAERVLVRTRLHGTQLAGNTLAALATGIVAGVSLQDAAHALADFEALPGRLRIIPDGHGVSFVADTWKCTRSSFAPALDLVRKARVPRKWIVIGALSDFSGSGGDNYRKVAAQCLDVADGVLFVGPMASSAAKAKNPAGKPLKDFSTVRVARDWLSPQLQPGDLVLLKGSGTIDHIERLVLDRQEPITCWREKCGLENDCSACKFLRRT